MLCEQCIGQLVVSHFVYLSTYLSIYLFIYLSIYLYVNLCIQHLIVEPIECNTVQQRNN